ncbi:NAD(P)-dependent oxidoreductase [Coprobacter tertius]|uniref:NAD(P)-dependent oxidoreductase n=1 Tax=Coprobacter tertius TaxID=2944915 RepID=A0ABT1MI68_9BACT|nr:NAD(P)-dependent oxidoreductase [Coprobacter tertius]MCP9610911.1 NAD(P)-dependent oxidoreductase [Coprobacter tertius]
MKSKNLKFDEINEGFTIKEAIEEAKRCLNCKNPACIKGCPIENNIPLFINQLSMGNMGAAIHIINEKSNLPAICGRVCPHEKQCVGHCVLNAKGMPINIGKLERFAADFDEDMGLIKERLPQKGRGKVAVIGSGPAGLTVAGDLAREGFNVVIYESQPEPGGVLMYGIPEYRLPKEVVKKEIKKIEALGVTFFTHTVIGKNITVDDIFEQGYDAVFIGSGTALPKALEIPGYMAKGIIQSSYFLRMVNLFNAGNIGREEVPVKTGETIGVIGCGNVGIDAARTALRMGASKVKIIYHRTEKEMSALKSEYEEAVKEGVEFLWNTNPKEFVTDDKNILRGIKAKTAKGEKKFTLDRILLAVGSRPANRIVSTTSGIEVDNAGYVITKEKPYGMTTRKGVFAGGDVVHTPQTVVLAMKEAKQVAKGIAQYIDAKKLLEE